MVGAHSAQSRQWGGGGERYPVKGVRTKVSSEHEGKGLGGDLICKGQEGSWAYVWGEQEKGWRQRNSCDTG